MKTLWFCALAPLILNIGYLALCFIGALVVGFVLPAIGSPFTSLWGLGGWLFYLSVAPPMVYLYAYLKENYQPQHQMA